MTDFNAGIDPQSSEEDPAPDERVYYRHTHSGDRGYIVKRGGRDVIRLDRANEEIIKPLEPTVWRLEREHRPLTNMALAQIAYRADSELCFHLGEHDPNRKEWKSMYERERIKWMRQGPPPDPKIRQVLWRRVMETLAPIAS